MKIKLDNSCIHKVISKHPYVKLLSIPKFDKTTKRWEAIAQVNEVLAIIEVRIINQ